MNCTWQRLLCKSFIIFQFILFGYYSPAQKDSATAAASTIFKTNGVKQFWMGSNYRKEWLTPIKAPIINLATTRGGVTPVRRGGGKQTRSLRVTDASGRMYTFRSIQKFITSKTLPGDLQSKAAENLVADGVSASYPYSTLSIPPLAEAAGIPYGKVDLVYIPDDPRLGEYRQDFANMLALIEDRLPEGVEKAYDTGEVVDKLKDDNDNSVDQHALLTARILDMFVMDFDRHEDQWQWGAIEKEKGKTYFPIPRDRDQAFFINSGVVPGMAKWAWVAPQLQGFRANAKNINRFNFAARNLDRFFLNELNEEDWKKAVEEFIPKMTDKVIEKALAQQPVEIRSFSADKIVKTLKERRKYLEGDVMQYYHFLSEIVNVTGSDKKELFSITRNPDGSVLLQVFKINKEGEQSSKMYERTFDPAVTKELRLYAFGGDDQFVIKGSGNKIKIRMIGGDGKDRFENTSGDGHNYVYDIKRGENTISGRLKNKMENDTIANSYNRLYYKYNQVIPFVTINYNRDDGLFLGFSMKFIKHGFRKDPYKNMHAFAVNHSLLTKAYNFRYYNEYIGVLGRKTDLLTDMNFNSPAITNFFGYGDQTEYDKEKPGKFRYYNSRYDVADVSLRLRIRISQKVMMAFGPAFQFFSLDSADNVNHYINETASTGLDPETLYSRQVYAGGKYSLVVDTRDNQVLPQKGIYWHTTAQHLIGLNDYSYDVTKLNTDFTFHVSLIPNTLIFVNRFGGGHNFGNFEFHQAQYLGNEDNLRGYHKNRFAGRSKIYNNAELRLRLATFQTYLFPAFFGVLAFYDMGKIWDHEGKGSDLLTGYGGGFWFAPLKRLVFTFNFVASKETKLPLIGVGWNF